MDKSVNLQSRLREIQDDVVAMGNLVNKAIDRSIQALKKRDLTLAHQIIADDEIINRRRFSIENKCVELIATQQLTGSDLNTIVAVLNIITELERIGDYAEGIANVTIMIGDEPPLKPLIDIPRMAEMTIEMVTKSLQSFVARDVELAKQVVSMDSVIDALNDQVFRELITFMMIDPKNIK